MSQQYGYPPPNQQYNQPPPMNNVNQIGQQLSNLSMQPPPSNIQKSSAPSQNSNFINQPPTQAPNGYHHQTNHNPTLPPVSSNYGNPPTSNGFHQTNQNQNQINNFQQPPIGGQQTHLPPSQVPPQAMQSAHMPPSRATIPPNMPAPTNNFPPNNAMPPSNNNNQIPGGFPQNSNPNLPPMNGAPNMGNNNNQYPNGPNMNNQMYNNNQNPSTIVRDLLKESKSIVSPDGWFINEPDMSFTQEIPGRRPPEERVNCMPEIMRSTLGACPADQTLLKKAKLPFGILMQPFRDVSSLSVITTHKEIVRCARCRMYINPFVSFINQSQWRCNMCNRINEVPQHFMQRLQPAYNEQGQKIDYDYPETRPEINCSTIEYMAPQQYSTRAPPPVRYVYLLDVSSSAVGSNYIKALSEALLENLENIKERHDKRLQISFIFFNEYLHFFEMTESGIHHLIVPDFGEDLKDLQVEELLPRPESLLINVNEYETELTKFLTNLPEYFTTRNTNPGRALGPAIKACCRLLQSTGGRCSIFLGGIPTCGYGKLTHRNDSNSVDPKTGKCQNLHSASDIYKEIALECNGQQNNSIQMGIDLFFISGQYSDISTISNLSRWSSGSIYYYPGLNSEHDPIMYEKFRDDLNRYLTRKIGFEAVLRVRMTQGLKIQEFFGNAFVRGEDILSLANVNPDAGFSLLVEVEEELIKNRFATFQMGLLYTNSRGERRVRVHTMTMPILQFFSRSFEQLPFPINLKDLYFTADGRAVAGMLSQMAVARSMQYSLNDSRTSLENAVTDCIKSFNQELNGGTTPSHLPMVLPNFLAPFPLYIHALFRHPSLNIHKIGNETVDFRVNAMCQINQRPIEGTLMELYPSLYRVDNIGDLPKIDSDGDNQAKGDNEENGKKQRQNSTGSNDSAASNASTSSEIDWETPNFLPLTAELLSSQGIFLLDNLDSIIIWVGQNVSTEVMRNLFGKTFPNELKEYGQELPIIENSEANKRLREFVGILRSTYAHRPFHAPVRIVRDDTAFRTTFIRQFLHDRMAGMESYMDFLNRIRQSLNS